MWQTFIHSLYNFLTSSRCGQYAQTNTTKTGYNKIMIEATITEKEKAQVQENAPSISTNGTTAYVRLRRVALVGTLVLIVILVIALLYINGKSLYDHGL